MQSAALSGKAATMSTTTQVEDAQSLYPFVLTEEQEHLRREIREFAARGSGGVLWTSHNMYELQEVCDRVLFLSRGKNLLEGDPRRLPQEHGKASLEELFIAVAREPLSLEPR